MIFEQNISKRCKTKGAKGVDKRSYRKEILCWNNIFSSGFCRKSSLGWLPENKFLWKYAIFEEISREFQIRYIFLYENENNCLFCQGGIKRHAIDIKKWRKLQTKSLFCGQKGHLSIVSSIKHGKINCT